MMRLAARASLLATRAPRAPAARTPGFRPRAGRSQSSLQAPGEAAAHAEPPAQPNTTSRVVDFIIDNGRVIFGSICGVIVYYLVRTTVASSRRDAMVLELEQAAPISTSEITALGRANALPPAVIRAVIDRAFSDAGFPEGLGTAAEASLLVRSEARTRLSSDHPLALFSRELRAPIYSGSVSSQRADGDSELPPITLIGEHALRRATDMLALQQPQRRSGAEMPGAGCLGAELDAAALVSLYALLMACRNEPPPPPKLKKGEAPPPPPPADDSRATPSERLGMLLEIVRRAEAQRKGSAPAVAGDAADPDRVSARELRAAIELLARTFQLPPKARLRESTSWPLPVFAIASPAEALADAVAEAKLPQKDRLAAPPLVSAGATLESAAPDADADVDFSVAEARRIMFSRAVCAWGECYKRDL